MDSWIDTEFGSVELGDVRRNRRLQIVAESMWRSPQASVSGASNGCWAEAKGAYRLWENPGSTPQAILAPHYQQTLERAKLSRLLLHVQDTTELDYTGRELKGTGPLSELTRRGFFAHSEYLLQEDGLPLGLSHSTIYARADEEHKQQSERRHQLPIEEKESYRWLEGYRRACELRGLFPNRLVISMSDREGDIYEGFEEYFQRKERGEPFAHWIIRCNQDRNIIPQPEDQAVHSHIKAAVAAAPVLGTTILKVRFKEQCKKVKGNRQWTVRSGRKAELQIRACQVELKPPWRPGAQKLTPLKMGGPGQRDRSPRWGRAHRVDSPDQPERANIQESSPDSEIVHPALAN